MVVIIPARLQSQRFPGKPLARLWGKPLIEWTWRQASQLPDAEVLVASSDSEILCACRSFGAPVFESLAQHATGTSRVAEAARQLGCCDHGLVVGWQVDEPLIPAVDVARLCKSWSNHFSRPGVIGTLVGQIPEGNGDDPNLVKAACSYGQARWFSRAPMAGAMAHVGIYVFWGSVLQAAGCPVSPLGEAEDLEQLAWIEHGIEIRCQELSISLPSAINTPQDIEQLEQDKEAWAQVKCLL